MSHASLQTGRDGLAEIVSRIVDAVHPIKIVLFGSRARDDAHPGSDLDLLIVTETDEPRHVRSAALYGILSDIPLETDIVVYSPAEVSEWTRVPQAFVTTALREGQVLYERPG